MKYVKNSFSSRVGSVIFFLMVLALEIYLLRNAKDLSSFVLNNVEAEATLGEISENYIEFVYFKEGVRISCKRDISELNKFVNLKEGAKLNIRYADEIPCFIIVSGYDEEPNFFLFALVAMLLIISQVLFLGISLNMLSENKVFPKRVS